MVRLVIPSAGVAEFSDSVFVTAQRPMRRAVQYAKGQTSAIVLRKYSVPLLSVEYCPTGEFAGHTVNPGNASTCRFSTSVTLMLAGWAASCALESAKTCDALKLGPN